MGYGTSATILFVLILGSIITLLLFNASSTLTFCINEVSLTQFSLTNNNTLHYKFMVNISVRNPHKNMKMHYNSFTVVTRYKDNDFAMVGFAPFVQGGKNTTFLEPAVFEGRSLMVLKPKQLDEYYKETLDKVYNDFAVDLELQVRYKYGRMIKSTRLKPRHVQFRRLTVPLIGNGELAPPFNSCKDGALML